MPDVCLPSLDVILGVFLIIHYSLQSGDLARGDVNNSTNFQKNITEKKHMLKPCDVNLTTGECFDYVKNQTLHLLAQPEPVGAQKLIDKNVSPSSKHLPQ